MNEVATEFCIVGALELPPGHLAEWRAAMLDARAFDDWPEAFRSSATGDEDPVTVGAWLDDCARYERGGGRYHLDIDVAADHASVRGLVDGTEYDRYRLQLVTLFRLAERVDGRGLLTLVSARSVAAPIGYRVHVGDGASSVRGLSTIEIEAAQESADVRSLLEAPVRPSPPPIARPARGVRAG